MNLKKLLIPLYRKSIKIYSRLTFGKPIVICMYHRINNNTDKELAKLAVSPENFREHMLFFKKHYSILDINSIPKRLKKQGVIITFDDGYADNLYNALPILEELNIPAIIFPSTININKTDEFWWEQLTRSLNDIKLSIRIPYSEVVIENDKGAFVAISNLIKNKNQTEIISWLHEFENINQIKNINREEFRSLTSNELLELVKHPLVTIGLHTHNHYQLNNMSKIDQHQEIIQSIEILSTYTKDKPIKHFAFPFGAYNEDTLSICKELNLTPYLANNRISNLYNLEHGIVNRILIPNIEANELNNYINQFI